MARWQEKINNELKELAETAEKAGKVVSDGFKEIGNSSNETISKIDELLKSLNNEIDVVKSPVARRA